MKQCTTKSQRQNFITSAFDRLTTENQEKLLTFAIKLEEKQKTVPESKDTGRKRMKSIVKKEQEQKKQRKN